MDKKQQFNFSYILLAFMAITVMQFWLGSSGVTQIPYSEYQQLLTSKQVTDIVVSENRIAGKFKTPQNGKTHFQTRRVDPAIAAGPLVTTANDVMSLTIYYLVALAILS